MGAMIVLGAFQLKTIWKTGYIKCKVREKLRRINPKLIKWRPHCTELMSASKIGCIQIFAAKKLSIYNFSTSAAQHLIELGQFLQNYLQHLMIYIKYLTCLPVFCLCYFVFCIWNLKQEIGKRCEDQKLVSVEVCAAMLLPPRPWAVHTSSQVP